VNERPSVVGYGEQVEAEAREICAARITKICPLIKVLALPFRLTMARYSRWGRSEEESMSTDRIP
jgi:hypothetical protein